MSTASPITTSRIVNGREVPAVGVWTIDKDHSTVEFVARHLLSKVRGGFTEFSGEIVVADDPAQSRVAVTIDANSVRSNNSMRDNHLRSKDFFAVERFPQISFTSHTLTPLDQDSWALDGDLTIKDITQPVRLTFSFLGVAVDSEGVEKAAFSAYAEVDRENFGLGWNAAVETGGVVVGKTVRLEFEIQAQPA